MKKIFTYMMMAMTVVTMFTSCQEEDGYLATTLRNRDWQGYIGAYYQDRWRLSGSEYETVMRFESKDEFYTSGRGYEVNFDTRSPYEDYAYCTFKWFIVDGEITLIYDDSKWDPIYIVDYHLYSTHFYGYIYDGTNRRIKFDLTADGTFDGWDTYRGYSTGSYGDFWDQQYYYSRKAMSEDDFNMVEQPLVINRTEEARKNSGEPDAVSIASGKFAEAMMSME